MANSNNVRRPASLRSASIAMLGASMSLIAANAMAQQPAASASADGEIALDTLRVEDRTIDTNPYAQKGAPYLAAVSGDERHTKPLVNTPQTITVITQTQIKESGLTDLRDILAAQPGVTVGTGENGNAFGDRYIIRGQEARSDVFIDGLRDPGMTLRESFAVEQIEISKGPNSTFAGRGTAGGAINSITKRASTDYNFNRVEAGIGTDQFRRVTLDSNIPLSDKLAVRGNFLHAYEEVPDRGPADRERNGAALSLSYDIMPNWNVTADYYYLKAEDKPDMGTYIPNGGNVVKNAPVYLQDSDFLNSEVDVFTLRTTYNFSPSLKLSNSARYGATDNAYVLTGGRTALRGLNDTAPGVTTWTPSAHQGWQEVEYFVNNLNLYWDVPTGPLYHEIVAGVEYSDVKVLNGIYSVTNTAPFNCRTGTAAANNQFCLTDPSGAAYANVGTLLGRNIVKGTFDSDYQIETVSVYLMDTIDITEKFSIFAGARYDEFDYSNLVGANPATRVLYDYSDGFWSGHIGAVFKPNDNTNVYLTYSSSNEINGGESDVGGTCGYGGICNGALIDLSKPERSDNIELGLKQQFFDDRLMLTAAIFETTKNDVMEGADYTNFGTLNTGQNRVKGYELSLVGNVTEQLAVQIGYSSMDSEVLKSAVPANIGAALSNFADQSAFAHVSYQLTPEFSFGGAMRYASERYGGQPDTGAAYNTTLNRYAITVPDYTVYDLFADYDFSEKTSLRLNVGNVGDTDYYLAAYRSGSFTYIGDKRSVQVTLSHAF